jgi:exportin-2 (importin alpha re-exporter)
MVLEKLFVPDLQKVSGNLEKKICAVGVIKIITECAILLTEERYNQIW